MKYQQAGNALFLILIAVALFAALSYAITQSSRGGGNVSKETTSLATSNLIQYMQSLKTGVDRLLILGCSPYDISFETPDGRFTNASAPADNSCHLFHTSGAGLTFQDADTNLLNSALSGESRYGEISIQRNYAIDMGDAISTNYAQDFTLPYVTDAVCLEINQKLHGISTIPENTSTTALHYPTRGDNPFSHGHSIGCDVSDLTSNACGTNVGCFKIGGIWGGSTEANMVYQLLLPENP